MFQKLDTIKINANRAQYETYIIIFYFTLTQKPTINTSSITCKFFFRTGKSTFDDSDSDEELDVDDDEELDVEDELLDVEDEELAVEDEDELEFNFLVNFVSVVDCFRNIRFVFCGKVR